MVPSCCSSVLSTVGLFTDGVNIKTDYKGRPWWECMSHFVEADPWGGVVSSRVWSLLGCPFGCATCVVSWIMLWCGLKPPIGCAGSKSTWVRFRCRLISDIPWNQPWATCLELSHNLLFVATSTGPGVHGRCQAVYKDQFPPVLNRGRSVKVPRHPEVHLLLLATLLLPEVIWSSLWAPCRESVEWAQAGHIHRHELNRACGWDQGDEASGSCTWGTAWSGTEWGESSSYSRAIPISLCQSLWP